MNSWHQRGHYAHLSAHIRADDWLQTGKALCGSSTFRVHIDVEYRNNPANRVCKRCKAVADKREADAEQWRKASPAERAAILGI